MSQDNSDSKSIAKSLTFDAQNIAEETLNKTIIDSTLPLKRQSKSNFGRKRGSSRSVMKKGKEEKTSSPKFDKTPKESESLDMIYLEDLADEVIEKFNSLDSKITSHVESINTWTSQMSIQTKSQISTFRTELTHSLDKMDLFLKRIEKEREQEERILKRDLVDINKMYDKIVEIRNKDREYFNLNCIKDMQNMKAVIGFLVKSVEIQQALERQDELDRKGVMFLGMVEDNVKNKPIFTNKKDYSITIDSECLSCSKQQSSILKAFKIACISYKPSRVKYFKSTYTREELIEMREDILKEEIENLIKQLEIEYQKINTRPIKIITTSKVAKNDSKIIKERITRKINSPTVIKRVVFSNECKRNQTQFKPFNSFM